jgi:dTDP-glucose 4,6-dehydratase
MLEPWKGAARDLEETTSLAASVWRDLRGARIFLTGGTGFVGRWLAASLLWANDKLGLDARLTILTRDEPSFRKNLPALADHPSLACVVGDARSFAFPKGDFSHVVHAAGDLNEKDPDSAALGTAHVLDFARHCAARRFLFVSSGAVYGPQPPDVELMAEDQPFAPSSDSYCLAKRQCEQLCLQAKSLEVVIARGFAFIGPGLPLDRFAVGNFIRDALAGGPIRVRDGSPFRSYLYASDLAVWLWTLLLRGKPGKAYNVGSENAISILDLARKVGALVNPIAQLDLPTEKVAGPAPRYVPRTTRALADLRLKQTVSLDEGIHRTAFRN